MGWRRRHVLASAGAAAGGIVLAGCAGATRAGGGGASSALPAVAAGVTRLVFQANWQHLPWNKTSISLVQEYADSTFNATNKGLYASVAPGGWGGGSPLVVQDLAQPAAAPDVWMGCCTDFWDMMAGGPQLMVPLDQFISKDNIDSTIWNKGHLDSVSLDGHLYGLPSYDGPIVMCYRQDILDELGLAYPGPDWTHQDAAQLWAQCAGSKNGKHRYGVAIRWLPSAEYLLRGFGGSLTDPTHSTCTLDSAECVAAGEWFYNLFHNKVTTLENGADGLVGAAPTEVFSMCGGWELFNEATRLAANYKWNILPVPKWPKGFSTFVNHDAYFINGVTKRLDAAWELMKWLCVDPGWTRFQMHTTLIQPGLVQLWDEWIAIVQQVAPTLANKDIHYYRDAALSSGAYTHQFFRYGAPTADSIVSQWDTNIQAGKVSPAEGFKQATQQINGYEVAQRASAARLTSVTSRFPTQGPDIAAVPQGI